MGEGLRAGDGAEPAGGAVPAGGLPAGPGVSVPDGRTWWENLLREVAAGHTRIVVPTSDGADAAVVVGKRWLDLLERALAEQVPSGADAARLSAREREVLALIADGTSAALTARRLGLAVNTVHQHLTMVRRKFGVASTADAVAAARRTGALPRPERPAISTPDPSG